MPFNNSTLTYFFDFSIVKGFISKHFELHRLYERCYVNKFCHLFLLKSKSSKQVHPEIQPLFTFSIKALDSLLEGNLMGRVEAVVTHFYR